FYRCNGLQWDTRDDGAVGCRSAVWPATADRRAYADVYFSWLLSRWHIDGGAHSFDSSADGTGRGHRFNMVWNLHRPSCGDVADYAADRVELICAAEFL